MLLSTFFLNICYIFTIVNSQSTPPTMIMVFLPPAAVEFGPYWYLGRYICLAQTFFGLETREGSSRDFELNLPAH